MPLILAAFVAGMLTFLAPCTLPLVPAYLGFIAGTSAKRRTSAFTNGLLYVIGFSIVFIGFGLLFGLSGIALASYRAVLEKIGGVLIIFFGLYLMHVFDHIPFLQVLMQERRLPILSHLTPGSHASALIFGATFALGWTPCVGPILGTVLFLASTTATAWKGAVLLGVFSLGLAIPFLGFALAIDHATKLVKQLSRVLPYVSFVGGLFLLLIGVLLLTGNLGLWGGFAYRSLNLFNQDALLEFL